jgi:hypothetical protein
MGGRGTDPAVEALDAIKCHDLEVWLWQGSNCGCLVVIEGVECTDKESSCVDWNVLIASDGLHSLLPMGCCCVGNAVPMVGDEEVVDEEVMREVLLELREDPHVGTDVEVMRPTIAPDVDCADAVEAVARHDVLPEASNKVDVVWNPLIANIVIVVVVEVVICLSIMGDTDAVQDLDEPFLQPILGEVNDEHALIWSKVPLLLQEGSGLAVLESLCIQTQCLIRTDRQQARKKHTRCLRHFSLCSWSRGSRGPSIKSCFHRTHQGQNSGFLRFLTFCLYNTYTVIHVSQIAT